MLSLVKFISKSFLHRFQNKLYFNIPNMRRKISMSEHLAPETKHLKE